MFDIIDGGGTDPDKKKKDVNHKVEQLKVFVSHMRALENQIAQIKFITAKIGWDELDARLTSCHDQILDTLSFVKKSSKDKKNKAKELSKPPKKDYLKIIKSD